MPDDYYCTLTLHLLDYIENAVKGKISINEVAINAYNKLKQWSWPLESDENERSNLMALFCSTNIEKFNEHAAKFQTENEGLARKMKHFDIPN